VKPREALLLGAAGALSTVAIWAVLTRFTDDREPWWDAGNFAYSLVAQGMLAFKIVENWALWVVLDVVTVGISIRLALYPTAALYAVLTVIASIGWRDWRRDLASRKAA
jgi:nicotinamide mononucleotide transporter